MIQKAKLLTMSDNERKTKLDDFERGLPHFTAHCLLHQHIGQVAMKFQMWVIARQTNKASLPYIGNPNYQPKGIWCHAKTAKYNAHTISGEKPIISLSAGLVADPTVLPNAFDPSRLPSVKTLWNEFARFRMRPLANAEYEIDSRPGSRHFGCLMKNKKWIYGDLDLFDVIKASDGTKTKPHTEVIYDEVNIYSNATRIAGNKINLLVGVGIVQHGAHADFADFDSEALDVFAPDGRMFVLPTRTHARGWYLLRWPGRKTAKVL